MTQEKSESNNTKKLEQVVDNRGPEHRLFGELLKELLMPLNVQVDSSYPISKGPPELDVIISRKFDQWTPEQLSFMPTGIKENLCKYNILELKYSQSVNEDGISQLLGYRSGFKRLNKLKATDDICAFLITSKSPSKETLLNVGFESTGLKGVYCSNYPVINKIVIISINDLAEIQQNMLLKLFASKKSVFVQAVKYYIAKKFSLFNDSVVRVIIKIISFRLRKQTGGNLMQAIQKNFTREEQEAVVNMFNMFAEAFDDPRFRFIGIKPKDVTDYFDPKDIVANIPPKYRLAGLAPQERLAGLSSKDLKQLKQLLSKYDL
jgi:hypothetical protein